ncbi:MAG: hypothetical protein ACLP9D_03495 [Candidatus Bathyarchaeia archaeon]
MDKPETRKPGYLANKDIVTTWLEGIDIENTRETYGYGLRKLLKTMKVDGEEALKQAREDPARFWIGAKSTAAAFKPSRRHKALNALRTFLRANDVYPPADRLKSPPKQSSIRLAWNDALTIIKAAKPPYDFIFGLMLHCGWGDQQLLQFNTKENWEAIRLELASKPEAKRYRHEFQSRKANPQPWYTLIPTKQLHEILDSRVRLPFRTPRGAPLDMTNYKSSRMALSTAFREAINRTKIPNKERIVLHELRDTFKSSGTTSGAAYESTEFSLGHTLDPRGYEKCYADEDWMWTELSKIYDKNEL